METNPDVIARESPSLLITGQGGEAQGRARSWLTQWLGAWAGAQGSRPSRCAQFDSPGLHTRRDGVPTARQALGHHRVWGAVTWCCWISLSTAALRVPITLAGDLQRKGPLRGQLLRLSWSLTLQAGRDSGGFGWDRPASLCTHMHTHMHAHTHTHTHTHPRRSRLLPCPVGTGSFTGMWCGGCHHGFMGVIRPSHQETLLPSDQASTPGASFHG